MTQSRTYARFEAMLFAEMEAFKQLYATLGDRRFAESMSERELEFYDDAVNALARCGFREIKHSKALVENVLLLMRAVCERQSDFMEVLFWQTTWHAWHAFSVKLGDLVAECLRKGECGLLAAIEREDRSVFWDALWSTALGWTPEETDADREDFSHFLCESVLPRIMPMGNTEAPIECILAFQNSFNEHHQMQIKGAKELLETTRLMPRMPHRRIVPVRRLMEHQYDPQR